MLAILRDTEFFEKHVLILAQPLPTGFVITDKFSTSLRFSFLLSVSSNVYLARHVGEL